MFTHFIRDVSFIVTFGDFWHSQLSILNRDVDMVQQTCIWLCGLSDPDPDSNLLHQECFLHYCRPSQFMFVFCRVCSQPWIIAIEGMEFSLLFFLSSNVLLQLSNKFLICFLNDHNFSFSGVHRGLVAVMSILIRCIVSLLWLIANSKYKHIFF